MKWIKDNFSSYIQKAVQGTFFTEDWLAGIAQREVGGDVAGKTFEEICAIRGDFTKRPGERTAIYHGYGIFQIDIRWHPEFIKSGKWKDPFECCKKAIEILEGNRKYLQTRTGLQGPLLEDGITAAFNCGAGKVREAVKAGRNIDTFTTGHDYSKAVRQYRDQYICLV